MADIEQTKANVAIPTLRQYTERLVTLVDTILNGKIRCEVDNDHFGFMILCYLFEQRNHFEAIRQLELGGLGRSAGMIARAMIEGLALLKWASVDSHRPLKWRAYALVHDWRLIARNDLLMRQVTADKKAQVEHGLQLHRGLLLSKKAIEREKRGMPLPKNPYIRKWYDPESINNVFRQVKGDALYNNFYKSESERTHWSVASLGQNVFRGRGTVTYAGDSSPEDSATVLAVGFQALFETLEVADNHLKLGHGKEIQSVRDDYIAAMTPLQR